MRECMYTAMRPSLTAWVRIRSFTVLSLITRPRRGTISNCRLLIFGVNLRVSTFRSWQDRAENAKNTPPRASTHRASHLKLRLLGPGDKEEAERRREAELVVPNADPATGRQPVDERANASRRSERALGASIDYPSHAAASTKMYSYSRA